VKDEGVDVRTEFRNDEWHPFGHQTGDEMDVAAQSVELGNRNRALASSRVSQGCGKLRSAVQGIRALAH
jgi:hypothetical protein